MKHTSILCSILFIILLLLLIISLTIYSMLNKGNLEYNNEYYQNKPPIVSFTATPTIAAPPQLTAVKPTDLKPK
jgi:hypothetical protein